MKHVYTAFIKFQSELKPVIKNIENTFLKSSYADLSAILESVLPLLNKNELGLAQVCKLTETGTVLQTKIFHISGEEIVSEMLLPNVTDPQKWGAIISYYKRYSLSAICGVGTEDFDGEDNRNAVTPITPKTKINSQAAQFASKGEPKDLSQFVITFGTKYKGKKLSDLSRMELGEFVAYMASTNPNGKIKEFVDTAREYMTSM